MILNDTHMSGIVPTLKFAMKTCLACGQCLENCYLSKIPEKLAQRIMQSIKNYIDSDFQKKLPSVTKNIIWRCCVDEYCNQFCPQGISKGLLMIGLRFILLQKGDAPFLLQMANSLLRKNLTKDPNFLLQRIIMRVIGHVSYPNKWIKDEKRQEANRRLELAKNPQLDQIEKGATLFMPGCGHTYGLSNIVQLTMAVLDKAEIKYYTIGTPEFCCGGVFAVAGFLEESFLIGDRTGKLLAKLKPERVITACPGCYMAYSTKSFPTGIGNKSFRLPLSERLEDAGIEVVHLSEYLEDLIKSGNIRFTRQIKRPIATIPSCSTGKRNETLGKGHMLNAQNEVLKSIPGVQYEELSYTGKNSRCCGMTAKLTQKVASLNSLLNPDLALKSQKEVISDALSKGVHDVATICGGCVMMYGDGLNRIGNPLKVWDLIELVAYSMGIEIYPREHAEMFNWMQLSPPFTKLGMIHSLPRLVEVLSDTLKYILP